MFIVFALAFVHYICTLCALYLHTVCLLFAHCEDWTGVGWFNGIMVGQVELNKRCGSSIVFVLVFLLVFVFVFFYFTCVYICICICIVCTGLVLSRFNAIMVV